MENPIKTDDLGVPLFSETPIWNPTLNKTNVWKATCDLFFSGNFTFIWYFLVAFQVFFLDLKMQRSVGTPPMEQFLSIFTTRCFGEGIIWWKLQNSQDFHLPVGHYLVVAINSMANRSTPYQLSNHWLDKLPYQPIWCELKTCQALHII